jgi:hypothetical protein
LTTSLLNEYISKRMSAMDYEVELMRLISDYNKKKNTYLLIYAVDLDKAGSIQNADLSLIMADYHIIHELLRDFTGNALDLYLETPGGSGEAAEEIVEFLHSKFESVDFVIAGEAKSAGTLMVMSADEIYMTESGSLGPIDAQVKIGRSVVSAFDYVQWMEQKRKEAAISKQLNPVDATMIAQITPGEFEGVFHAQQFAVDRLREWLPKYKFKHWKTTETRKIEVSDEMKRQRAEEIAKKMIDHSKWRSHGRSLKIKDLEELGLRIKRIESDKALCEIVYRIKTVVKLLFGTSTHFKMFVTEHEKLFRDAFNPRAKNDMLIPTQTPIIEINFPCPKCGKQHPLYAKFGPIPQQLEQQIRKKSIKFPPDNKLTCDCGFQIDLIGVRNQLEKQIGKKMVE